MGYIRMPNGSWHYYGGNYQYSKEHGAYWNNQREETELVNRIVDQKLNDYSRMAEQELEQSIKALIDEYGSIVWERLLQSVMHALQTDIVSEVQIGFQGCNDIFHSSKVQSYVSDRILKAVQAELSKIKGTTLR